MYSARFTSSIIFVWISIHHSLFLGICDSEQIDRILRWKKQNTKENVCALRFGSTHRMTCTKDVGVRMGLAHSKSSTLSKSNE